MNYFLAEVDKGEFRWRVALGVFDELVAKGIPPTGTSNFRAFDKDTFADELIAFTLP